MLKWIKVQKVVPRDRQIKEIHRLLLQRGFYYLIESKLSFSKVFLFLYSINICQDIAFLNFDFFQKSNFFGGWNYLNRPEQVCRERIFLVKQLWQKYPVGHNGHFRRIFFWSIIDAHIIDLISTLFERPAFFRHNVDVGRTSCIEAYIFGIISTFKKRWVIDSHFCNVISTYKKTFFK